LSTNCLSSVFQDEHCIVQDYNEDKVLYGIPVSLKECFDVQAVSTTLGFSNNILKKRPVEDSVVVKVLKHHGAVPFVKTNISQSMLSFGSNNPIYGQVRNPHDPNFSPGGSSSGEGALISSGGSLLGIGTDIVGCIRCPAHMCGCHGFKPTTGRVSHIGCHGPTEGQKLVTSSIGPLARDVDSLVLCCQALFSPIMHKLDPTVCPLPFNFKVYQSKEKMRIGYYLDDGYMLPVPACQRAVIIAKEALLRSGHTLVPFSVQNIENAIDISNAGCKS